MLNNAFLLLLFGLIVTANVVAKEKVIVSYRIDSKPIQFKNAQGKAEGMLIDYWKILADKANLQLEFIGDYNKQAQQLVVDGIADANSGLFKSIARLKVFDFSASILSSPYQLFFKKEKAIQSLSDINGLKIGVTSGSYHETYMRKHYPNVQVVALKGYSRLFAAAKNNEIDAFVSQNLYLKRYLDEKGEVNIYTSLATPLYIRSYRIAVKKGKSALLNKLNKAISLITEQDKLAISSRWLGTQWVKDTTSDLLLSEQEKQFISNIGEVKLGIDPSWPPIEYFDELNNYQGLSSSYIEIIQNKLNIPFSPQKNLTWQQVIEKIKHKEIDLLPAVIPTINRNHFLNFTQPYLSYPYMIFVHENTQNIISIDDLENKTVGVEKSYASEDILKTNYKNIKVKTYRTTSEVLLALSKGEVDAYFGALSPATYAMNQLGMSNVKIAAPTKHKLDLTIGVRKDWPVLLNILNKTIASISQKQRQQIKNKWFSVKLRQEVDYRKLWQAIAITVLVLGIIVLFFYWSNQRLKKEIAQRLKVEKEMQRNIFLFNQLLDNLPVPFFAKDKDLKYSYSNAQFRAFVGKTQQQLIGKTIHQVYSAEKAHEYQLRDERLLKEGDVVSETLMHHSQGTQHNMVYYESVLKTETGEFDGLMGLFMDITERKKAEKAVLEKEAKLTAIFEASQSVAFIIFNNDDAPKITEYSSGAKNTYLYNKDEIIGQPIYQLFEDKNEKNFCDKLKQLKSGLGSINGEVNMLKKNGQVFPVIFSLYAMYDENSKQNATLLVTIDISDRKQAEIELQKAKKVAETANEFKSQFLANMSHEIRTPMNAIIGFSYLALQTELTDGQRDYLKKIQHSSNALLGIINDILDYSKIEAGKLSIEHTPFTLDEVLTGLSDMVIIKAEEKGIELLFDVPLQIPQQLIGDPLRLGQVLLNLVQNAIKFTEQGEVVVRITLKDDDEQHCHLLFEVNDTGIGIKPEKMSHLFKSFAQADGSTTRQYGGTGLGLSISKNLVNLMGGHIDVISEYGYGSSFYFDIKFKKQTDTNNKEPASQLKNTKVLVVDDNPAARTILSDMLLSFGLDTRMASSGQRAINELERVSNDKHEKQYDVVLMDWKMPEKDGMETIEEIRKNDTIGKKPAMVVITSYGREELINRAEQVKIDGFLLKPVSPSLLFDTVVQVVSDTNQTIEHAIVKDNDNISFTPLIGEVLLVEDNIINRDVAKAIFLQFGITVAEAENGLIALEKLTKHRFDLVVTDIQMPQMDGYQLAEHIRNNPDWHNIPIIAMTAHAMEGDKQKSLKAGMNEHITKPIDPIKTYQVLNRFLKQNQAQPSLQVGDSPAQAELDFNWGINRIGGNKQLYKKLLTDFIHNHADDDKKIQQSIANNDQKTASRIVHTIKGVSSNIGAMALAKHAEKMEQLIGKDNDKLEQAVQQFSQLFKQNLAKFKHWLNQNTTPKLQSKDKTEAFNELNQRLVAMLKQGDMQSIKTFTKLERFITDEKNKQPLADIKQHINDYEFDEALALYLKIITDQYE